jgi:predicted aconitase with swiveling domain
MTDIFQVRPILAGDFSGAALVSRQGFNTLASFQMSVVLRSKIATCGDQNNPDIYKKAMTGKILCLPQTIGSTAGGLVIQTIAQMGNGPLAMLFSERADSLAAGGAILADIWVGKRIYVIDNLGSRFLEQVKNGDQLRVYIDGRVEVGNEIS